MAMWVPNALAVKGALDAFHQRIDSIPEVWRNYATIGESTTATETYAFANAVPEPRVMTGERHIQGMGDANFTVTNDTHELTILVHREAFEDDQVSGINSRFRELAEVYATYKDSLFTALLVNGATGLAPLDATAFFADTRVFGASANIDNNLTSEAAAGNAVPLATELVLQLAIMKAAMLAFQDDVGRPFNVLASTKMRLAVMPAAEYVTRMALRAAFLPMVAADGATDNVNIFQDMAELDVLPYHTASSTTSTMYLAMLGAERKPILYQQRTPLEIIVDMDPTNVAERNGVLVMCRERYKMTYGDPRRMVRHIWTT